MTERKIKVVIDPMGNPKIEAEGFMGQGCEAATAPLENALKGSGATMEREYKQEWGMTGGEDQAHDYLTLNG